MEISAYRLLYDNIHDFKRTAAQLEAEMRHLGVRDHCMDEVPSMKGRTHHETWVSMKTVSHFNLGIAMELLFKLLLYLNEIRIPHHHKLAKLHDAIPSQYRKRLELTYQNSRRVLPEGYQLVAFINSATPTAPKHPQNRDIINLREFLVYLDEDVMLWQKRYSWELVEQDRFRHYISDISVFVEFINRVMSDIKRF